MHRTRLVRVSFVLFFTTAFVSSAAAQPGLLRKLDLPGRTRALRCSEPSCTRVIWNTP